MCAPTYIRLSPTAEASTTGSDRQPRGRYGRRHGRQRERDGGVPRHVPHARDAPLADDGVGAEVQGPPSAHDLLDGLGRAPREHHRTRPRRSGLPPPPDGVPSRRGRRAHPEVPGLHHRPDRRAQRIGQLVDRGERRGLPVREPLPGRPRSPTSLPARLRPRTRETLDRRRRRAVNPFPRSPVSSLRTHPHTHVGSRRTRRPARSVGERGADPVARPPIRRHEPGWRRFRPPLRTLG